MTKLYPDQTNRGSSLPSGNYHSGIHGYSYCEACLETLTLVYVEVHPLDERIKELCAKAAAAEESEVEAILRELNAALRAHAQFVRTMSAHTLNRAPKYHRERKLPRSSKKAA